MGIETRQVHVPYFIRFLGSDGTIWLHWFGRHTGHDVGVTGLQRGSDRNDISSLRSALIPH